MVKIIHPIAGGIALFTIAVFWLSTVASELFAAQATVIMVKTTIPWGFFLLIPALALTGATGIISAKQRRGELLEAKLKRMPQIAANGLLVLVPSALFLAAKAKAGEFDTLFYAVQLLELLAGATNIVLLARNMQDGLRLAGKCNQ